MSDVNPKVPRVTQVLLSLLVIGIWGVLLLLWFSRARSAADASADKRFDVITAERINIVDADGKPRLVISNTARFPDAAVRGKSINAASEITQACCSMTSTVPKPAAW
jgi:hypothetical protein